MNTASQPDDPTADGAPHADAPTADTGPRTGIVSGARSARLTSVVRHPLAALLGAAIGAAIALLLPASPATDVLATIGRLYLAALSMTVLPIICAGVIGGLGALVRTANARRLAPALTAVFLLAPLAAGMFGAAAGAIMGDHGVGMAQQRHLGGLLLTGPPPTAPTGLSGLVDRIIAPNLFDALARGESLAIVVACILIGLALGSLRHDNVEGLLAAVRSIGATFLRIVDGLLAFLPLGLAGTMVIVIRQVGLDSLGILILLVGGFYVCGFAWMGLHLLAIACIARASPWRVITALRAATLVSFCTSSSVAAMPIAMQALETDLGRHRDFGRLIVPLAVTVNRQSYPILFALLTVLIAGIHGQVPGGLDLVVIGAVAGLAGAAAVGSPALVAPLLEPVLVCQGLPPGLGTVLLIASGPILDPLVATMNIVTACGASVMGEHAARDG